MVVVGAFHHYVVPRFTVIERNGGTRLCQLTWAETAGDSDDMVNHHCQTSPYHDHHIRRDLMGAHSLADMALSDHSCHGMACSGGESLTMIVWGGNYWLG